MRVVAAAAAQNLKNLPTFLSVKLLNDSDTGVRKWTLKSIEVRQPVGIKERVEEKLLGMIPISDSDIA